MSRPNPPAQFRGRRSEGAHNTTKPALPLTLDLLVALPTRTPVSRRVSAGSSNNPVFSGSRANTGAGGVNFANRGNTASNNANGNINANKGSNVNGNNNDNGNNRGTNSTNTNAKNDGNIIDNRLSAFPTGPRLQTPPSRRSSISSRGPIVLQPGLPPLFPAIAPTVSPTVSPPPRQVDLASPNLPYQPSAMGNHDRSPRGNPNRAQPLLMQDDWKRYPEKMVFIRGLAGSITIKDIFLTLRQFATIEMIELMLDGRGDKTGEAKLRCTTVLDPFWEKLIDFGNGPLRMRLGKLSMPAVIPSRVNPSKIFPEKFKFKANSLQFGFFFQPEEFMAMYSLKPGLEISWEINLKRKSINITFKVQFEQEEPDTASVTSKNSGEVTSGRRTDIYLIEIPFTQLTEILVPASEDSNGPQRTFMIPLHDPPKFSRQLGDWTKSMKESGLTRWNIFDVWMRQTDIEFNMRAKQSRPVGLLHRKPVIDIGRWTTYQLSFELQDATECQRFKGMMDALKDFNIPVKPSNARVNFDKSSLTPIWNYLDKRLDHNFGPFLGFPVRYQLEVCISHGYLNEHNITPAFVDKLAAISEKDAVTLLERVQEKKTRFFDPMEVFSIPRDKRADSSHSIPDTHVLMRRATVTPTGIFFQTPSVEISNRIIRQFHRYADRFIRISFTDEKSTGRIRFTDKHNSLELFSRVFRALKRGIVIGDRQYEFLAFGNSQLREHGAYFFAPTDDMTAAKIREWMGVFREIRVVAKYSSRLGQCFSTTKAFRSCKVECKNIPDIVRNDYTFTDGVGKISPILAILITEEMMKPQRRISSSQYQSSCFQFRLGGCKGVLALDPSVPNLEAHIRESQVKFWSRQTKLEIIRCSQFASASLNRQLIQVMTSLGVPNEIFQSRLEKILNDYTLAVTDPGKALELLRKHVDPNHMTLAIANLVHGGLMASKEPFVKSLLNLWRAWTIKYLKEKAKITIEEGAFLLGVVDETAILRGYYNDDGEEDLSQIFCQVTRVGETTPTIITGRCIVARNPSLHPGDVRMVEAVDVPELHHLVDVVVFPQTGDRDIPSMLSGGDLDGDDYVVIWDHELTAPGVLTNYPPALYGANSAKVLDRDVTIEDVKKFFVNYMKNDRLGSIANSHLAWADKLEEGVKSTMCLELAQLHSDAVDYPKSGVKARMTKKQRIPAWPHFFNKPVDEGVYHSTKILGLLYDMVEMVDFTPSYEFPPNQTLMTMFTLTSAEIEEARELKADYDAVIRRIMAQHDISTEFEVWSTFVMSHGGSNDYKFHEEIGDISFALKERFRKQVMDSCTDKATELPRKVVAMYVVTAQEIEQAKIDLRKERERLAPRSKGKQTPAFVKEDVSKLPLMSFPWVFPDLLVAISHGNTSVAQDYSGPGHADVHEDVEDDEDLEEVSVDGE